MNIFLQSVTIIHKASPFHGKKADVLIKNGHIAAIAEPNQIQADASSQLIHGENLCLSAGWLDMRANFCDPGQEHKEDLYSGAHAAAAGGFTEVVLLPNTSPVIQSKNDIRYLQQDNGWPVTVHPVAAVTRNTAGEELTEMIDLHHAGAIAFSDGEYPLWNTQVMLKALQYMQKFDGLLMSKPEDRHLNTFGTMHEGIQSTMLGMSGMPALAEEIIVQRDLRLLMYASESSTGRVPRLHFSNISTAEAVAHIREAKQGGLQVSCDVAAHQLYFDDTALSSFDTNYKVNPPLRDKEHQKALLEGVKDGTIDLIVSSHSPQDEESKKCEFDQAAFGMIGLQTFFPMVNSIVTSSLPLALLLTKFTEAPRKLLRLAAPQLEKEAVANLTLFSPDVSWVFDNENNFSKSSNSPLLGTSLQGKVIGVFNKERYWLNESVRS